MINEKDKKIALAEIIEALKKLELTEAEIISVLQDLSLLDGLEDITDLL